MNIPLRAAESSPQPQTHPLLRLHNVRKTYRLRDGSERVALDGVTLDVPAGEILAVIGLAGSGKSTLAGLVAGLEEPSSGVVAIDGVDLHSAHARIRRSIAVLDATPDLPPNKTVREIVAERREVASPHPEEADQIDRLFQLLEIDDDADRAAEELSDGARRRAALARALAGDPRLLILDEATSALDPELAEAFLLTLARVNAETGLTILLITHDMAAVTALAPQVAVLDSGRIVEQGATARVFARPEHPVSRRFAAAATGATIPPFIAARLMDQPTPGGKALLRLAFDGPGATRPVLTSVARELGFDLGILAGSLGAAGGQPYGVLIVAAPSDDPYYTAAVERLEDAELGVEVLGFLS